ncbi:hypothetical protein ACI5KX_05555 [Erythrobacter sp. GH1-10]|uniref:hypothetical protein n=1 Tax=Erythrobacter sp. GH1-10 TaxID=3349334 RepID=UPI0038781494
MDMDLLIAVIGSIILLSIVGLSVNGIVSKVLDYKRSQAGIGAARNANSTQVNAIADRTEMIEDRLRVLERLATDRGQLLADEIEALRDRAISHEKSKERA